MFVLGSILSVVLAALSLGALGPLTGIEALMIGGSAAFTFLAMQRFREPHRRPYPVEVTS